MKNNKGILFAPIIITIIIMFILAAFVINLYTSEDGIGPRAKRTVAIYNREKAKEDITLAWNTIMIDYEGNNSPDKNKYEFFTIENLNSISYINENGIVLEFDYDENISKLKYVTYSDNTIYDMMVDNSGVMVTKTTLFDKENSNYLIDNVEIGDYIDLGINYDIDVTNSQKSEEEEEFINTGHLGWKVLKKDGFGITGRLILISANCPLEYNEEVKNLLDNCEYIDKTKEIYSVTEDEILESYKNFEKEGKNKDFEDFWKDIDITNCLVITLNYGLEIDDIIEQ